MRRMGTTPWTTSCLQSRGLGKQRTALQVGDAWVPSLASHIALAPYASACHANPCSKCPVLINLQSMCALGCACADGPREDGQQAVECMRATWREAEAAHQARAQWPPDVAAQLDAALAAVVQVGAPVPVLACGCPAACAFFRLTLRFNACGPHMHGDTRMGSRMHGSPHAWVSACMGWAQPGRREPGGLHEQEQTPSAEDAARRRDVVARIDALVRSGLDAHRHLFIAAYGSFLSGLYAPTGDLDLSIEGQLGRRCALHAHPSLSCLWAPHFALGLIAGCIRGPMEWGPAGGQRMLD